MRLFSIIIFSIVAQIAIAQNANALFTAIGKSDIATLSANFSSDIEICIGTAQDFYTKNEAKTRLNQFFTEVSPSSGSFLHKGKAKDNSSEYSVGNLKTEKGNYRVFIYFEGSKVVGLMFNPE